MPTSALARREVEPVNYDSQPAQQTVDRRPATSIPKVGALSNQLDIPADRAAVSAAWWRSAVIYQIYPRSFADANGDGIGDLNGVRSKLPYLADLGVDAIWLSPFYPSPQADAGYDVSDYCDVDPVFGTLDDAKALIGESHERGLRIVVDLVPNHTSDRHAWFQAALAAGPGSPERARYIFRDGPRPRRRPAAEQLGVQLRRAGLDQGRRTGSGTCTCSPRSSRTWTGRTRRWSTSSRTSCGSGSISASTGSASTSPTAWPRTRPWPTCRTAPSGHLLTPAHTQRAPALGPRRGARGLPGLARGHRRVRRRPGVRARRPGCPTRTGSPSTCAPDELHTAFNFNFLDAPLGRRRRCAR